MSVKCREICEIEEIPALSDEWLIELLAKVLNDYQGRSFLRTPAGQQDSLESLAR